MGSVRTPMMGRWLFTRGTLDNCAQRGRHNDAERGTAINDRSRNARYSGRFVESVCYRIAFGLHSEVAIPLYGTGLVLLRCTATSPEPNDLSATNV